jgi:uncharacterized membrane protein YbhN (UPF0104 family)
VGTQTAGFAKERERMNAKTLCVRIAVSATILMLLCRGLDRDGLLRLVREADPGWMALAAAWVAASMAISTGKWRRLLLAQEIPVSWGTLWRSYWVGLFFNNFLPSSVGFDAIRVLTLRDEGRTPGILLSVVVERLLALAGLALVGAIAVASGRAPAGLGALFAVGGGFAVALVALVLFPPALPSGRSGTRILAKIRAFLSETAGEGRRLRAHPRTLLSGILWGAAFQLTVIAVNYSLLRAFGASIGLLEACAAIPAVSVAAMIPLSINGFGFREGATVSLLGFYGIAHETAFAVSLSFALLVAAESLYGGLLWIARSAGERSNA